MLPPSVRDWLPEGHLAWFVLETVEELDLASISIGRIALTGTAARRMSRR